MPAPVVYRSTDASAPTLSGTAGDLINLLDKCLVTGYGSKSAAGWSKPYTGTNLAVFRQGAGNQRYLRVNDNAPGAGGAKEARVRGWEATPDTSDTVDPQAGRTGPFPNTVSPNPNGLFARKSTTADATTRPWIIVADDRTFYCFVQTGDNANVYYGWMFGEIYSYSTGGDSYNTAIICRQTENDGTQGGSEPLAQIVVNGMGGGAGSSGHFIARAVTGLGGPVMSTKIGDYSKMTAQIAGRVDVLRGVVTYPNPTDGGLWLYPVRWIDSTNQAGALRGHLRGFYHMVHPIASFADGDTFSGAAGGPYAGKTFLIIKNTGQGLVTASGAYCIETTAWDTN